MRKLMEKLRRLLKREPEAPPDDYAMAGAPRSRGFPAEVPPPERRWIDYSTD